jgi:hypothetical protein
MNKYASILALGLFFIILLGCSLPRTIDKESALSILDSYSSDCNLSSVDSIVWVEPEEDESKIVNIRNESIYDEFGREVTTIYKNNLCTIKTDFIRKMRNLSSVGNSSQNFTFGGVWFFVMVKSPRGELRQEAWRVGEISNKNDRLLFYERRYIDNGRLIASYDEISKKTNSLAYMKMPGVIMSNDLKLNKTIDELMEMSDQKSKTVVEVEYNFD